jgi:Protein of unknown function (DUF2281)
MSQAFDHIVQELDLISEQEKCALRQLLDRELAASTKNGNASKKTSAFGWAKGQVIISSDFDAPIEDFKDYSE